MKIQEEIGNRIRLIIYESYIDLGSIESGESKVVFTKGAVHLDRATHEILKYLDSKGARVRGERRVGDGYILEKNRRGYERLIEE